MILVKLDESSGDHPPPRLRINLLLEEFEEKGYFKTLKDSKSEKEIIDFFGLFSELKKALEDIKQSPLDEFQELVIDPSLC